MWWLGWAALSIALAAAWSALAKARKTRARQQRDARLAAIRAELTCQECARLRDDIAHLHSLSIREAADLAVMELQAHLIDDHPGYREAAWDVWTEEVLQP